MKNSNGKFMKTTLTQSEMAALLPHIYRALATGEPWKDEALHHPAGAIIGAILTIKGMAWQGGVSHFESNGWQYDWLDHFTHGGKEYTLSGSGYYGGHKFYVSE